MTEYHPIYGALLTSRQASDLTGFTMNQLRNFRQRPETAPFGFVRQGGTSWYRKDDIEAWLEKNGAVAYEYIVPASGVSSPLRSTATDSTKREVLSELAKITTKNAWGSHGTWLTEQSGLQDAHSKVNEWAEHFWRLHLEDNPDAGEFIPLNFSRIDNPSQYWQAITWAVRRATAYIRNWEVTDREIMDIPVGEVPPSKIV
jgi:hypothetical protein